MLTLALRSKGAFPGLFLAVLWIVGCQRRDNSALASGGAPELQLIDSVVLAESDSAYLGKPVGLAVDEKHGIYISDAFSSRVFNFTRAGKLKRVIGRRGTGPGELMQPAWLAITDEGVLAVADYYRHMIALFDAESGAYVGMRRVSGRVSSIQAHGSSLLLGALNLTQRTTSLTLDLASLSTPPHRFGPFPEAYDRARRMTVMFPSIQRSASHDSSLLVMGGIRPVFLLNASGSVVDSFVVPRRRRRGLPADVVDRAIRARTPSEVWRETSIPYALAPLSRGRFALVYFDPAMDGRRITGAMFLSVLSLDSRTACADIPLPASGDVQARVAFAGDTIFVLDQKVSGARAITTVRGYVVRDSACAWLPMQ
jgi:hypothetical protein